jgi:hypothetical protein
MATTEEKVIDALCVPIMNKLKSIGVKEIDFGHDFIDFKVGQEKIRLKASKLKK